MALKGIDIFKLTPKTNCKECGNPTCMAFAMKVAQGAVSIEQCPHMSDEAKAQLSEAIRRIKEYEGLKEIRVRTNSNLIAPRNYESVGFLRS